MINTIEKQINESDYTAMDIAAAFLKLYMGQLNEGSDTGVEYTFDNTGAEEEGMARLFINIGKAQKVKAKDILGAIAGEANIPGKLVGAIDLYDKYTFVEVPKENAADVLAAMKNVKIKGKTINIGHLAKEDLPGICQYSFTQRWQEPIICTNCCLTDLL